MRTVVSYVLSITLKCVHGLSHGLKELFICHCSGLVDKVGANFLQAGGSRVQVSDPATVWPLPSTRHRSSSAIRASA